MLRRILHKFRLRHTETDAARQIAGHTSHARGMSVYLKVAHGLKQAEQTDSDACYTDGGKKDFAEYR
jgi:hypothetical protein